MWKVTWELEGKSYWAVFYTEPGAVDYACWLEENDYQFVSVREIAEMAGYRLLNSLN